MANDSIPQPERLPNKPLVEAIFELRWALREGNAGDLLDPGYAILPGRFYERVRATYPFQRPLDLARVPEALAPYAVRHQFRAAPNAWPVSQLGPGVLTVNDTESYDWDASFEILIHDAIKALFASYPEEPSPLRPNRTALRYKNAIEIRPDDPAPLDYLRSLLHTTVELDPMLINGPGSPDAPRGVSTLFQMPLRAMPGIVSLQMSTGEKQGSPAWVLDIGVAAEGDACPHTVPSIIDWLRAAHDVAEACFFRLVRGDLLQRFKEGGA